MQKQFNALFADELIAKGSARVVWSSKAIPDCVIKIEDVAQSFQNVNEWELWNDVKDTPDVAKWLAPCRWISPDGSILLMERTTVPSKRRYPDRLPKFLTDTKFQNYGLMKGRFVCHDYGSHVANTFGATTTMRAAHWWDAA
jgi:hypothetical protein